MPSAHTTPRDSTTAKAPQLRGWVEIFKAGTHTDSKGRAFTASVDDLDQIIANHELGRAPGVLGHPKDNDPAYCWVDGLKRDGESLFAKFGDINPAFDDGVALGAYRNRSIKIVRDKARGLRLWHVGWLGAQPPAIDGLSPNPVQFGATDDLEQFEFAADGDEMAAQSLSWAIDSIGRLLRGLRDHVIEQEGVDVADRILPSWQIDTVVSQAEAARAALAAEAAAEDAEPAPLFSHPSNSGDPMTTIQLSPAQLEQRLQQAREEAAAQFAAQGAELAELRAQRTAERVNHLISDWKTKGLIVPADEASLREFMGALHGLDAFEFSASEGQDPVKKQPLDFFAEFMAARKPAVALGEAGRTGELDEAGVDLNNAAAIQSAATEFQKSEAAAGRSVSFEFAVQHVSTAPSKA